MSPMDWDSGVSTPSAGDKRLPVSDLAFNNNNKRFCGGFQSLGEPSTPVSIDSGTLAIHPYEPQAGSLPAPRIGSFEEPSIFNVQPMQWSLDVPLELDCQLSSGPSPVPLPTEASTSDHDICCFGVIITPVSSFAKSNGSKVVPVNFTPFSGKFLKLRTQDDDSYAGILKAPSIRDLLSKRMVQLQGTLISIEDPSSRNGKSKIARDCSLRIIVHGAKEDKEAVGNLLSDGGFFLQHPSLGECGQNVEYNNPHYLLRPGAEMPALENSCDSFDTESPAQPEQLTETFMARLVRIFDDADGDIGTMALNITPSPRLRSTLMEHQLSALAMMTEKECGIVARPRFPALWETTSSETVPISYRNTITGMSYLNPRLVKGGILADDMGLGKTLSILALICSSLDQAEGLQTQGTLIVAPKSTIPGWENQISRHVHGGKIRAVVYHGTTRHRLATEFLSTDIVLTTYETLRSDWASTGPLFQKKWLRVVLDEAHHIRNRFSKVFQATIQLRSIFRWCVTGTPMQNSLDDFGALLSFLGVEPFAEKQMFNFWITNPVKKNVFGGVKRLQDLVKATCLRRTKKALAESFDLPPPIHEIEYVQLSHEDQNLYDFFKDKTAVIASKAKPRGKRDGAKKGSNDENILSLMNFLRRICGHGENLLPPVALKAWGKRDSTSININMMRRFETSCKICGDQLQETHRSLSNVNSMNADLRCVSCSNIDECSEESVGKRREFNNSGLAEVQDTKSLTTRPSAKVQALLRKLLADRQNGDDTSGAIKSCWTDMLDLVELSLQTHGITSQRIDGQATLESRSQALREFSEMNDCTVMLASIGSCGEGVDFTAASKVHLLEPHWNPMAEAQAVDRVHRKGQTRQVTVFRYIVPESIETYIQWVQRDKLQLFSQSMNTVGAAECEAEDERWKMLQACLRK